MGQRLLSDCLLKGLALDPAAPALDSESGRLAYRDLAHRAGRLRLPAEASRIALWADQSADALVAAIGIQALGRTCVPIDPLNPPERAVRILEGIRPGALLAPRTVPEPVRELVRKRLPALEIAEISEALRGEPGSRRDAQPDDPAYVLCTSGSTGHPKGVTISHRAAVSFVDWAAGAFGLDRHDRVASVAPLHFDLSLFDLYSTLSAGATICLCSKGVTSFPETMLDWLRNERITTLYATPTLLASLVGESGSTAGRLSLLKNVLFAGEVMPATVLSKLMREAPQARFHNLYGPTETNVCTSYSVESVPAPGDLIPIGYPCPYNRVEIVRPDGSPAAAGEIGEIRVDGPNVMSGYWGGPAQEGPYLTGDFGFADASGLLHFRGRRDGMLKVRGYRIDPGEIEAALSAHPEVSLAAAFKSRAPYGAEIVAAAVVLKKGSGVGDAELRLHCARWLPSYMIPSHIEIRDHLPTNAHGKVDRTRLSTRCL